jgi:elongation factor P--beta-lysine ligase
MVRDFAAEKKRQRLIKMVRTFFEQRGFREVVTPFLSTGAPLEPTM